MAYSIWKFKIVEGENKIEMPKGAKVLSAAVQHDGNFCIWVSVDKKVADKEYRYFYVATTGEEFPEHVIPYTSDENFMGIPLGNFKFIATISTVIRGIYTTDDGSEGRDDYDYVVHVFEIVVKDETQQVV